MFNDNDDFTDTWKELVIHMLEISTALVITTFGQPWCLNSELLKQNQAQLVK